MKLLASPDDSYMDLLLCLTPPVDSSLLEGRGLLSALPDLSVTEQGLLAYGVLWERLPIVETLLALLLNRSVLLAVL